MPDRSSYIKRSHEVADVSSSISIEAQEIVLSAAGQSAGLTVKGQIRKAARALGYPDGNWRVRAAWYGEAGTWSAASFEELRDRYRTWSERPARLADAAADTLATLKSASGEGPSNAQLRQARVERMAAHARTEAARRRGADV